MHIGQSVARVWGKPLFRSTQFAAIVLFAVVAISLSAASARAFSQGNGGTDGGGNSTFADPDERVNIFGFDQGAQPSGLSGSAQFGPQQSQLTRFKHFQSNGLSSPPDPLSRPSN
jgi:hypothetical protein